LMQSRKALSIKASHCNTYAGTLAAETDVIRRPFSQDWAQVIDSSQVNARAWGCDGARECGEPMRCGRRAFQYHSYPGCTQPAAPFPRLLGACAPSGPSENIRLHNSQFLLGKSRISGPSTAWSQRSVLALFHSNVFLHGLLLGHR
jgi:hypothetical protein